MKSRDFAYWLQGLFELGDIKSLDERQTDLIKRHLNLVFKHDIDPSMGPDSHQKELNEIHEGVCAPVATTSVVKEVPPQPKQTPPQHMISSWDKNTLIRC